MGRGQGTTVGDAFLSVFGQRRGGEATYIPARDGFSEHQVEVDGLSADERNILLALLALDTERATVSYPFVEIARQLGSRTGLKAGLDSLMSKRILEQRRLSSGHYGFSKHGEALVKGLVADNEYKQAVAKQDPNHDEAEEIEKKPLREVDYNVLVALLQLEKEYFEIMKKDNPRGFNYVEVTKLVEGSKTPEVIAALRRLNEMKLLRGRFNMTTKRMDYSFSDKDLVQNALANPVAA